MCVQKANDNSFVKRIDQMTDMQYIQWEVWLNFNSYTFADEGGV